jgi:hypothetical protein
MFVAMTFWSPFNFAEIGEFDIKTSTLVRMSAKDKGSLASCQLATRRRSIRSN